MFFGFYDAKPKSNGIQIEPNAPLAALFGTSVHEATHKNQYDFNANYHTGTYVRFADHHLHKRVTELEAVTEQSMTCFKLFQQDDRFRDEFLDAVETVPDTYAPLSYILAGRDLRQDNLSIGQAVSIYKQKRDCLYDDETWAYFKARHMLYFVNNSDYRSYYFKQSVTQSHQIIKTVHHLFTKEVEKIRPHKELYAENMFNHVFNGQVMLSMLARNDHEQPFIAALDQSMTKQLVNETSVLTKNEKKQVDRLVTVGKHVRQMIIAL